MPNSSVIEDVRDEVACLNAVSSSAHDLMTKMVALLHERMLKYNWVGFYMLDEKSQPPMLVLGPFQGPMTPHTRIPLHQGICGAAASTAKTVVVDDVGQDPRYLACSLETKSEIVAPVFREGRVVGELDIDSHFPAAFTPEDRQFVESCAALVGKRLEGSK